jgi:hypothetical protein
VVSGSPSCSRVPTLFRTPDIPSWYGILPSVKVNAEIEISNKPLPLPLIRSKFTIHNYTTIRRYVTFVTDKVSLNKPIIKEAYER